MKMRVAKAGVAIVMILLTACEYEAPLTTEHSIPIDPALLGIWGNVPESGEKPDEWRILILEYSPTEYLIYYPAGENGIYFRAYPIKVGDLACVQLKTIGSAEGPAGKEDEEDLFQVAAYTLNEGMLEVRLLNSDLVDNDLKTQEALRSAFIENTGRPDLFDNPGRFRKKEE